MEKLRNNLISQNNILTYLYLINLFIKINKNKNMY